MNVPSGVTLSDGDIELLQLMARYGFVQWRDKPYTLKSGIQSHVYVFGREDLTDHPEFLLAVGKKITDIVHTMDNDGKQPCLIGVPMAGIALATAASLVDAQQARDPARAICYRIMRQQRKQHGAHRFWVDGRPDFDRHAYITIDNVVSDGGSKIEAGGRLIEDGYPAKEMPQIIFIDRQQGATQLLIKAGYRAPTIVFNLLDMTHAYRELGLWSSSSVDKVEEEIKAHQFV